MGEDGWPPPWWEIKAPRHLMVLGREGAWWQDRVRRWKPASLQRLGAVCERLGVTQVWVHQSALELLGLPEEVTAGPHPFTNDHGDWVLPRDSSLRAWSYYYRKGGHGFDLHIPHYGRSVWQECDSAPELLARVAMFDRATRGVAWKGNGTITSDVFLRRKLRRVLQPTQLPPPVESGAALEKPMIWHRPMNHADVGVHLHALDLNLAYAAGASSLNLPVGECHHVDLPQFDPRLPGVYLVEDPEPRWVTAPTMERIARHGGWAVEGWIWPEGYGRHLRAWYEMVRDARTELLVGGGVALEAVKDTCREGLGRMASKTRTVGVGGLGADPTYQPYWAWAVIAEVRERLLARMEPLLTKPVAIDTDCVYFVSQYPSPSALAVHLGLPLGDGLGQFKPAGSCSAEEAAAALALPRSSRAVAALREAVK